MHLLSGFQTKDDSLTLMSYILTNALPMHEKFTFLNKKRRTRRGGADGEYLLHEVVEKQGQWHQSPKLSNAIFVVMWKVRVVTIQQMAYAFLQCTDRRIQLYEGCWRSYVFYSTEL